MKIGNREVGIFCHSTMCREAPACNNNKCLYRQKELGVHIWYMGEADSPIKEKQLELREKLGPWYEPKFKIIPGTNCQTVYCEDFTPLKR